MGQPLLPEAIARTLRCVPLREAPETLELAVVTPLTPEQVDSLSTLTGRRLISRVETAAAQVDAAIEALYGDDPEAGSISAA